MALANFFDRTAAAASQVLKGFDPQSFAATLRSFEVGLIFDTHAARSIEGWATLELVTNLVSRLFPRIAIVASGSATGSPRHELATLARKINPAIEIGEHLSGSGPLVVVGRPTVPRGIPVFYTGSDGWVAKISTKQPVLSGRSSNPFGAGAAACFAVANIFRHLFRNQLSESAGADESIELSLLDYAQNVNGASNAKVGAVNISGTVLVGAGAIGNGFVWALSRVPGVHGQIDLVDHELVDLSNLQRYVLTEQEHVGALKVDLAAASLRRVGIDARVFQKRWSEYVAAVNEFRVERVVVALDTARDRIAVQAALPREVFNAWTQTHDLGVSRHRFLGEDACLACLYLPDRKIPDEDEMVAQAFGLPGDRLEIRKLLFQNCPVGDLLVRRIAIALSIPVELLMPYVGKPIRTFYVEAVCGGVIFALSGGAQKVPTLVPIAFQSALAGIMLAAEVCSCSILRKIPSNHVTTTINLLRPLSPYLSFPRKKDRAGRCMCQDPDYVHAYMEKWAP